MEWVHYLALELTRAFCTTKIRKAFDHHHHDVWVLK